MVTTTAKLIPIEHDESLPRLVQAYLNACRAEEMSEETLRWYERKLGGWLAWLDEQGLSDDPASFGRPEKDAFVAYLQTRPGYRAPRISPFTVRGYVQVIKGLYTWLEEEGYIERSAFSRLRMPKTPEYVVEPISGEEIGRILQRIDQRKRNGARDLAIILLLLDSGMRLGELVGLTRAQGEEALQDGMLKVLGKGRRERHVPIGRKAQAALRRYIYQVRNTGSGALFLVEDGTGGMSAVGVTRMIRRRGDAAGVDGVHPHRFRHTMAVEFLRGGGDILFLQRILGHSTLQMTSKYVKLVFQDVKAAHDLASPADRLYGGRRNGHRGRR